MGLFSKKKSTAAPAARDPAAFSQHLDMSSSALRKALAQLQDAGHAITWVVFQPVQVQGGEGFKMELVDTGVNGADGLLRRSWPEERVLYAIFEQPVHASGLRVKKRVFLRWVGAKVPPMQKGSAGAHKRHIMAFLEDDVHVHVHRSLIAGHVSELREQLHGMVAATFTQAVELTVRVLDSATLALGAAQRVQVQRSDTLAVLRAEVRRVGAWGDDAEVLLFTSRDGVVPLDGAPGTRLRDELGVYHGDTVLACEAGRAGALIEAAERERATMRCRFKLPDDPKPHSVVVDARASVAELKATLAPKVGKPVGEFCIRVGKRFVKAEERSLRELHIHANTSVYVEYMPTPAEDEAVLVFSRYGWNKAHFRADLFRVAVRRDKPVAELKMDVSQRIHTPPELLRLRFMRGRVPHVMHHECTVYAAMGDLFSDGMHVLIQVLQTPDPPSFGPDGVVVLVRELCDAAPPEPPTLATPVELLLEATARMTFRELKARVGAHFGVDAEDVRLARGWGMHAKKTLDHMVVQSLVWNPWDDESTLWFLKDGEQLLFRKSERRERRTRAMTLTLNATQRTALKKQLQSKTTTHVQEALRQLEENTEEFVRSKEKLEALLWSMDTLEEQDTLVDLVFLHFSHSTPSATSPAQAHVMATLRDVQESIRLRKMVREVDSERQEKVQMLESTLQQEHVAVSRIAEELSALRAQNVEIDAIKQERRDVIAERDKLMERLSQIEKKMAGLEASERAATEKERELQRQLAEKERLHEEKSNEVQEMAAQLNTLRAEEEWLEIDYDELGPMDQSSCIGMGKFADVHIATWRGTTVAVKKFRFFRLTEYMAESFRAEVAMLRQVRHPSIVLLMGCCTTPPNLCIVTEFLAGGSLFDLLQSLSDEERASPTWAAHALTMARDIGNALTYLHKRSPPILHRDIKSHNVLVDDHRNVKLADLGYSRVLCEQQTAFSEVGTAGWAAPELLEGTGYTRSADVWSFGFLMYEMFTGRPNPMGGTAPLKYCRLMREGKRPPLPDSLHADVAALMTRCWALEPDERPEMGEVLAVLKRVEL